MWRFRDGKAGHERQTAGLVQALGRLRATEVHDLPVAAIRHAAWAWLGGRCEAGRDLPDPDVIVGAGRGCEFPLLAARRARGGRSIYLMQPRLPCGFFDLCFVPHHDAPRAGPHCEPTEGVLNDVEPAPGPRGTTTLVLVGGPSRHHAWDEDAILKQLGSIVFGSRERELLITDSRRTPASTRSALASFVRPGVRYVPFAGTGPEWLRAQLAVVRAAWVTADSASMIFEALTAGIPVGVIAVAAQRDDRISRLAPALAAAGRVTTLDGWLASGRLAAAGPPLAEAARAAALVVARWFSDYDAAP
ncbi:MAG: mitochondrial fission ELM1 family protein [Gammaproteobacteria bacterium]|nr:mitochondrial fission ELM1 family protein [Gammaproteobacteria bacterium]MBI5616323.1 mitochondrial fission ELM1 family protein [Gammaproteobacteria bacterium]